MERREFLQSVGQALALALAPGVASAGTLHGPDLSGLGALGGDSLVAALDGKLARIRDTANVPRLRAWVAARGFDPELPGKLFATLWVTSTFRDLPEASRRTPEIQAWMKDRVPTIAEATFELAELLESLDPTERDELATLLRDDPQFVDNLFAGFDAHAAQRGVEDERIRQVRAISDHTAWRIRSQSAGAVFEEYVARLDRVCRRSGIDRRAWREHLAREVPAWTALSVVADPDGEIAREIGEEIEPELVDDLAHRGAHLGVALDFRRDGAEIVTVLRDTPAERAGLRAGDRIESVDGRPLRALELVGWLRAQAPEQAIALIVRRDGGELPLVARLGAGPGDRLVASGPVGAGAGGFAYLSTATKITGVGLKMLAIGGISFGVGAVIGLLGLAAQSSGVAVVGAVLTILGALLVVLGLIVLLVGAIAAATAKPQAAAPAG